MIAAPRPARIIAPLVIGLLAAHLMLAHGRALTAPFFSDDFLFLEKVRGASLADLIAPRDLAYHWYRPWSREVHFAAISRAFGVHPLPFHLACFALWLAVLGLFFTLARRLAGTGVAAIATAGAAAQAGWDVPIEWGPGAQELWMMLWSLLALHAHLRRRTALELVCLALALLSKESAAVLPAIAFAIAIAHSDDSPARAARRAAPGAVLVLAWTTWHPALGGRLWWAHGGEPLPEVPAAFPTALARSLGSLVNMDLPLAPAGGWIASLVGGLAAALALAALAFLAARSSTFERPPSLRPLVTLGVAWMLIGWAPIIAPSVIWQPYYPLFGSLGAWLAIAAALDRRPQIAAALVLAVALLRVPRADTPSPEWGSESVHRAGKAFVASTERFLRERVPTPPRHARFYFSGVPAGAVFVLGPGDTPALRVWYRDLTPRGYYWSQLRTRSAADSAGPDYFFRRDSLGVWSQVTPGAEPPPADPGRWIADHENLAVLLLQVGDVAHAEIEYEKLAAARPDQPAFAFMAGLCAEELGERLRASQWFTRAASLPGASDEMRAKARNYRAR